MSDNQIERVKRDIEIIREAGGLELPFGWDSVLVNVALFPATGLWWLCSWFVFENPPVFWMVIPFIVLLAVLGYMRYKYRRSTGRPSVKRRAVSTHLYGAISVSAIAAGYFIWVRHVGMNSAHVAGGICLIMGGLEVVKAFQGRSQLPELGSGIPLILFGLSLLIWTSPTIVVINASVCAFAAGLSMGGIQMYLLKQNEKRNDTD